jgi:hypothetical protein
MVQEFTGQSAMLIRDEQYYSKLQDNLPIFFHMWTCLLCGQQFVNDNQVHSCGDKTPGDFFNGKSDPTVALFWHLWRNTRRSAKYPSIPPNR